MLVWVGFLATIPDPLLRRSLFRVEPREAKAAKVQELEFLSLQDSGKAPAMSKALQVLARLSEIGYEEVASEVMQEHGLWSLALGLLRVRAIGRGIFSRNLVLFSFGNGLAPSCKAASSRALYGSSYLNSRLLGYILYG